MLFSELPYELVGCIGSFLHISDILKLAITCTNIHDALSDRLQVHQKKVASLSTIDDRNRASTISALRGFWRQDSAQHDENAWYFREVVVHGYTHFTCQPNPISLDTSDLIPQDVEPFDIRRAMSDMSLPYSRAHHNGYSDAVNAFEGLLTLALLQMPRLSRLRFAISPVYGYDHVFVKSGVSEPQSVPISPTVLEFLMRSLFRMKVALADQPTEWPLGLQNLQSIEIEVDELQTFNDLGQFGPVKPSVIPEDFGVLFCLPNLKRVLLSRDASDEPNDDEIEYMQRTNGYWMPPTRSSTVEDLILAGFLGYPEFIQRILRGIRRLRLFVLQQRGNERHMRYWRETLQSEHASSLEVFSPPFHTSNTLAWCQHFIHLKFLTVSYVEVMSIFRQRSSRRSESQREYDLSAVFRSVLATRIPQTVEFVTFIGGQQPSTVTSVLPVPQREDIDNFITIVTNFVNVRGFARQVSPGLGHDHKDPLGDFVISVLEICVWRLHLETRRKEENCILHAQRNMRTRGSSSAR